jgi:CheY-like chemotaxis protein
MKKPPPTRPVEDSRLIVQLVVRMLSARGHAVESAANGSEGLARLTAVMGTAADFDLVLCDFQMPVRARVLVYSLVWHAICHHPMQYLLN